MSIAVECVRCLKNGPPARRSWHATGRIILSRRNRQRAVVQCDVCGYIFASGTKEALEAASAERGECELPEAVVPPAPVRIPQPSLPLAVAPAHGGFVTPAQLAKHNNYARFLDRLRRPASGE